MFSHLFHPKRDDLWSMNWACHVASVHIKFKNRFVTATASATMSGGLDSKRDRLEWKQKQSCKRDNQVSHIDAFYSLTYGQLMLPICTK